MLQKCYSKIIPRPPWSLRQQSLPNCWYPHTNPNGVISHNHQHLNHHVCDNLKSRKVKITVHNYHHLHKYQFGHIFLLFCCICMCVMSLCHEQLSLFNTTAPSCTHRWSFLVFLFQYHFHQFLSFLQVLTLMWLHVQASVCDQ